MDGDIFGRVTRIGRETAAAALSALNGGLWDPFCVERTMDLLVSTAVRRRRHELESSQRSRGLLFLAMGATVALTLEIPTYHVYETGIGCLNLPISRAQVASQGTRAMHPYTLNWVNELLLLVLNQPVHVVVPFFFHTKGELCKEAHPAINGLARVTMSCDEGEGHKPNAMEHCGLCTSCIFRRIALLAANTISDPTVYRDIPTRRHGAYELRAFEHHAMDLGQCQTIQDLVAIDPNARFAALAPTEDSHTLEAKQAKTLTLYQTYQWEISQFLSQAKPIFRSRPTQGKEPELDLFAAAG